MADASRTAEAVAKRFGNSLIAKRAAALVRAIDADVASRLVHGSMVTQRALAL